MTLLIVLVYLIGVVLSIGRHLAIDFEWWEQNTSMAARAMKCKQQMRDYYAYDCLIHLFSWITFAVLVMVYFKEKDKYFLKFKFYNKCSQ
jgi:phosphate starvation-inducible membrane PsiE